MGSGLKLRSYSGDCLAFADASKILHFCTSLVSFEISFRSQSQSLGTVQSLFLDTWQNPRKERFGLMRCASCPIEVPFKHRALTQIPHTTDKSTQ